MELRMEEEEERIAALADEKKKLQQTVNDLEEQWVCFSWILLVSSGDSHAICSRHTLCYIPENWYVHNLEVKSIFFSN